MQLPISNLMRPLTQEQIIEIADELEFSFRAFVHKTTEELLIVPDECALYNIDLDAWDQQLERIENHISDYYEIEKWTSHDSFEWMVSFAEHQSENPQIQSKLTAALKTEKPFKEFSLVIDDSDNYRQKWDSYKEESMQHWVEDRFKDLNESGEL